MCAKMTLNASGAHYEMVRGKVLMSVKVPTYPKSDKYVCRSYKPSNKNQLRRRKWSMRLWGRLQGHEPNIVTLSWRLTIARIYVHVFCMRVMPVSMYETSAIITVTRIVHQLYSNDNHTRVQRHAAPPASPPRLLPSFATLPIRYIVNLLTLLLPAPCLDCNRQHNHHVCTRSYMHRHMP